MKFWFEYASTYSYPAAMRIERLAAAAGVDVVWQPFLLGPLFHRQQGLVDSPFNAVPVKGRYMWRDLARICAVEGLPLAPPVRFPQSGLMAARITLALPELARPAFAKAVYHANFAEQADIADPAALTTILAKLGHDAHAAMAAAQTETVKTALRAATEEAERLGLFGAPSFVTHDGELFWGNDRLQQAIAWERQPRRDVPRATPKEA